MDLPPPQDIDWTTVPRTFHSEETGERFAACSVCGRALLEEGTQYLIEKGFRKGETTFEYALCLGCCESMRGELSEASLKRIEHYFGERVDLVAHRERMMREHRGDCDAWLDRCLLSGGELGDEYQIYAQCDGGDLLFAYAPYAISGKEIENLGQVLSKETRERLDDFIDDVLGVPGDGLKLPMLG